VQQGLKAGETVVTDGADKLKDGAKVSLRRAGAPPAAAAAAAASESSASKGQGQHRRLPAGQAAPTDHGGPAPAQ